MADIKHYISDFPVDFAIVIPPKIQFEIPEITYRKIIEEVVPFCESLKGKVISQFVDIEKHIGHLLAKAISGASPLVPPELSFELVIAPHNLDRKAKVLRKVNSLLPDGKQLPEEFFPRLDAARKMRNLFAHDTIVFIPRDGGLVPVFHGDANVTVDDALSKKLTTENYSLIEMLNTCYVANFPIEGLHVQHQAVG